MERHQGSWKVEGEEEYNIGELVIDNDYIEFFELTTFAKKALFYAFEARRETCDM